MGAEHMVPAGNGSAIDIIAGTFAVLKSANSISLECKEVSPSVADGTSIVNCES
jgi:hypothetical protein